MRSPLLSRCGAWIPLVVAVVAIDGAAPEPPRKPAGSFHPTPTRYRLTAKVF